MNFKAFAKRVLRSLHVVTGAQRLAEELITLKLAQGRQLANALPDVCSPLSQAEFRIFSQWGDDGIIQYLIRRIPNLPTTFIEFGVEDYTEANTRFLLQNNNWKGLIIDGSPSNMARVRGDRLYWSHELTAMARFVSAENINELISEAGFGGRLGILHVDIDGVDYWVWKAIDVVDPEIVIVEYNSVFGAERAITVPYDATFQRHRAHHSRLYYGASLAAFCDLAESRGMIFVGCNSAGNNAYFVKREHAGLVSPVSIEAGFVESRFRESRDAAGLLTFVSGADRLALIRGLPVINVKTGASEVL